MSNSVDNGALGSERTASRVTGAVVMVFALTILTLGGVLRPSKMAGFFDATSPGLMPSVVLIMMAVFGLLMIVRPDTQGTDGFSPRSFGLKMVLLLYLLAFTTLFHIIGWLLASLLLLLTMPLLAGYRNPIGIGVATALVLGGVWLIFVVGIEAPLP